MSSCGACTVTPAVSVSVTCSYVASNLETSVDVPPMSNPMTGWVVSALVVIAYPTTPPAGPERIALYPVKRSAGVRPPSDCMKLTFTPSLRPSSKPRRNVSRYSRMHGVRYESTLAVWPRGTARTMGTSAEDRLTCVNPISAANFPTAASWSGNAYECISTTASERIPSSSKAWSLGRSDSTSSGRSTSIASPVTPVTISSPSVAALDSEEPPSTPEKSLTRSAASTTRSYSRLGRLISRSKMSGLAWFPMARRSPYPSVTTSADRAPSRSSSAFVATVVPMRIHSMRSVGTGASRGIVSPVTSSRMRRIPSLGALS